MVIAELPSIEIILFLIAILIGVVGKIIEATREVRRKSLENQKRRARRFGEEEQPPPPVIVRRAPVPTIPMPTMSIPEPRSVEPPPRRRPPRQPVQVEASAPTLPPAPPLRPPTVSAPPARVASQAAHPVVTQLRSHEGLQAAYVMHEVMARPRAHRPFRPEL